MQSAAGRVSDPWQWYVMRKVHLAYLTYIAILSLVSLYAARLILSKREFGGGGPTLTDLRRADFEELPNSIFQKAKNAGLTYQLAKDRVKIVENIEYRTNSDGLRDYEYTIEKPPGTRRIIFLGDSFTFGMGVRIEDTYVKQLEDILSSSSSSGRWEVMNLGLSGFNAAQEVEFLVEKGLKYKPDIVVVVYFFNDPDCPSRTNLGDTNDTVYKIRDFLLGPSYLAEAERQQVRTYLESEGLLDRLQALQSFSGNQIEAYHLFHYLPRYWSCVTGAYNRLMELKLQNNFEVVVAVMPIVGLPWDKYTFRRLHAFVGGEISQFPFHYIDLLPILEKFRGDQLRCPTSAHTNAAANRIVAEALHEFMQQRGLVGPE